MLAQLLKPAALLANVLLLADAWQLLRDRFIAAHLDGADIGLMVWAPILSLVVIVLMRPAK